MLPQKTGRNRRSRPPISAAAWASVALVLLAAVPCAACFSIVVGKKASRDGCVLVAHNEDDSPPQVVNHHKVPRLTHGAGEKVSLHHALQSSLSSSQKLGVVDLVRILRHNGSSAIVTAGGRQVVCNTAEAICRGNTQTSFVARLGTQPSRALGLVYWVALSAPETSVFVPFPFGIADFPAIYRAETERPNLKAFRQKLASPYPPEPLEAFWAFSNFRAKVESMPQSARARITAQAERIEADALIRA
ncbi:MAG: hypothetical protein ACYC6Y_20115, partial [Thermoguttaceae bacterium]